MTISKNPGALKHRFSVESPIDIPDGAGGASRTWQTTAIFWGSLTTVSAREKITDGSLEQRVTHEIQFRYGPNCTTQDRLRLGVRLFQIRVVKDLNLDSKRKIALVDEVTA